ncbi:hypothetical protein CY35_01G189600 [Sphagnum magellanicum]|nr:hypothetical protein CY35_01G189600 [Sphagnum magellanicum]
MMDVENASSPLPQRKLKLLGIHGFRTSGDILRRQLSRWSPSILDLIDLDTPDGPFPCLGKTVVEEYFEGPYYEWFRFNQEYTEFQGVEDAISFISDYMKTHGPYDGLVGFSQGAVLSGLLAGLQEKGMALQDVASIKFVILTSPAQLTEKNLKVVYEAPAIKCPAVILLGEKDWLRPAGEKTVNQQTHWLIS